MEAVYTFLLVVKRVRDEAGQQSATKGVTRFAALYDEESTAQNVIGQVCQFIHRPTATLAQRLQRLPAAPSQVLGAQGANADDAFSAPSGIAWVPVQKDWLVSTESDGHRVKITDVRKGALICKFGHAGKGDGEFNHPSAVCVTSDSAFVVVVDSLNHRLQVLRLVVGERTCLEFVRSIGRGVGVGWGQLFYPSGAAQLLDGSILCCDYQNRVSQFALDGTFKRVFIPPNSTRMEHGWLSPRAIIVLALSWEVAVSDPHKRAVQIYDFDGKHRRQLDCCCGESLAADAYGNILAMDTKACLRAFSDEGASLLSRSDLALGGGSSSAIKGIAWSEGGQLALAEGGEVRVWWGRR